MKKYYKVGSVFGIEIGLHYSWFLIFFFLSYVLSKDYFPQYFPGLTDLHYVLIGTTSALFLFISVLLHELCHSLVARRHNIPIKRIQLFFFGGVAEINDDNIKPKTELVMALAGPAFSILFGIFCFNILPYVQTVTFQAILHYLARINLVLGIFNLMPGFPLDGGRAFRAVLWLITGDYEKSTYYASRSGKFFGGVLIFLGFLTVISGNFGGIWFILIGGFLFFMAEMSFEQVVIKRRLTDVLVKDVYEKHFDKLHSDSTVKECINQILHSQQDIFPVLDKKKKFVGLININRLNKVPKEIRDHIKIKSLMLPKAKVPKTDVNKPVYPLLLEMIKNGKPLLPVFRHERLVGIVSKEGIIHYLKVKMSFNI